MTWTREAKSLIYQLGHRNTDYKCCISDDEAVKLIVTALAAAERRGLQEAATVVNGLIGKDCGNWNRAIIHAEDAIRQKATP